MKKKQQIGLHHRQVWLTCTGYSSYTSHFKEQQQQQAL